MMLNKVAFFGLIVRVGLLLLALQRFLRHPQGSESDHEARQEIHGQRATNYLE
jgi:hypothetical protein